MITGWRRLCAWGGSGPGDVLLPSCTGGAGPAKACHGGWHVLMGPASAHESNELFGVSVASPGDVWAVGVALPPGGPARTLVERWQGGALANGPKPRSIVRRQLPERRRGLVGFGRVGSRAVPLPGRAGPDAGPALGRTAVGHHCQPECGTAGTTPSCRWRRHPRGTYGRSATAMPGGSIDRWWSTGMAIAGPSWRLPLLGGPGNGLNAVDVGRFRRRVGGGRIGQGPRPVPAAGPSARWTELVFRPRSREPAQRHAERGGRLGRQGGMDCWRHEERWRRPCLRPSGRWPELARRPHRPRDRAERRSQRHLGGRPGRCVGGRKLVRRPLVPAAGRARRRREVVEDADPRHPRLRRSSDAP